LFDIYANLLKGEHYIFGKVWWGKGIGVLK